MQILNIVIILILILHSAKTNDDQDIFIVNMTMKDYKSSRIDQIVYVSYKIPDEELAVIGSRPLVNLNATHHMDTFACETLYSQEPFWEDGQICGPGAQMLLYAWDQDALPLRFPGELGIAVGKNTPYKYLVVNIHYLPIVKNDYSGNELMISRKRRKSLAGMMLAGTNHISLPPKTQNIKSPFSCQYNGIKLSVFAAGVHAHRWGRVNSFYLVRNGKVKLIIKGDPQQAHLSSYRFSSPIEIQNGDYLIGQCVYDNNDDQIVRAGSAHDNEMCKVMVAYSYNITNEQQMNASAPITTCWGNLIPHLIALIPPESEIPPKTSSDMFGIDQNIFTNRKKIFLICLIIVAVFCIALILIVIVRNSIHHFQYWIFNSCLKRDNGFRQLEQSSDEENQLQIQ